ncbi:MAG: dioxygenase extradiol-like protein [Paenibacillus sp.]|nr:dioxygenase extradiol-like protein [Paenibacillus sp.]
MRRIAMIQPLFLAHGSPMTAIEDTEYTRFLEQLGPKLKPKAIVIFSAHWESEVLAISSTDDTYETIYDFGGFPPDLYSIKYKARGSKKLAAELADRFKHNGIENRLDETRGLDHGSWTMLHRMYPQADIPVVQLSVHPYLATSEQYRIGEALRGLDQEDILIIGSGVTVHNLRVLNWGDRHGTPERWATGFDDWLIDHIQSSDKEALFRYMELAPAAKQAVPTPEHFVPLYIALGSGDPARKPEVIHRSYEFGTLSYLSMQF